jgi:hypothetical protein
MKAHSIASETPLDCVRYYDLAHEICARVDADGRELTDDERMVISVIAAQAALAKYVDPGDRDAGVVLNKILRVLDHREMIFALTRKMHRLLEQESSCPLAERLTFANVLNTINCDACDETLAGRPKASKPGLHQPAHPTLREYAPGGAAFDTKTDGQLHVENGRQSSTGGGA